MINLIKKKLLNYSWIGYGNGTDGNVVIDDLRLQSGEIQGVNVTITESGILRIDKSQIADTEFGVLVVRALNSIIVNGTIDGKGGGLIYTNTAYNDKWGLTRSYLNYTYGSVGLSGGGYGANGSSLGYYGSRAQPVSIDTFLDFIRNESNYSRILINKDYETFPLMGGGGGLGNGLNSTFDVREYGAGAAPIILVAPNIIIGETAILDASGLGGTPYTQVGSGGGGGALIGLFGNNLQISPLATLLATGGGGSGGSDPRAISSATSKAGGYSISKTVYGKGGDTLISPNWFGIGAGGGGSTALNSNGGTPGTVGYGNQVNGAGNGLDTGEGGTGGQHAGSNKANAAGAGGAAGKIVAVQINK